MMEFMATKTKPDNLVPLAEVAKAISKRTGWSDFGEGNAESAAAERSIPTFPNWDGSPAVSADDAARLVSEAVADLNRSVADSRDQLRRFDAYLESWDRARREAGRLALEAVHEAVCRQEEAYMRESRIKFQVIGKNPTLGRWPGSPRASSLAREAAKQAFAYFDEQNPPRLDFDGWKRKGEPERFCDDKAVTKAAEAAAKLPNDTLLKRAMTGRKD